MNATATSSKFNLNTIVMSICTFVILAGITWVGHTTSNTHDSVIALEVKQTSVEASLVEIRAKMLTRTDLSVELLKLQVGEKTKLEGTR